MIELLSKSEIFIPPRYIDITELLLRPRIFVPQYFVDMIRQNIIETKPYIDDYREYPINCYATALGATLPYGEKDFVPGTDKRLICYNPGFVSGHIYTRPYPSELMFYFLSDMQALGIDVDYAKYDENLRSDEWLITLFSEYSGKEKEDDFHFMKRAHDDLFWFSRPGQDALLEWPTKPDPRNYEKMYGKNLGCYKLRIKC